MTRIDNLQRFINNYTHEQTHTLTPITADASFRRYYRLEYKNKCFIVMDSNPKKVNNAPYISLNQVFTAQGFLLPKILASDEQQGFFILTDLGSTHLADMLEDKNRVQHYQQLITLATQWAKTPQASAMQSYNNEFITLELNIFIQWLLNDFIDTHLNAEQQIMWQKSSELLTNAMLEQPTVTVHRDYHSRNIMCTNRQWAIIDYQDAVQGPLCYDFVSLLRDCYFKLPEAELNNLLQYSFSECNREDLIKNITFNEFKYWFDLTGLQRHLKAAGIFCRLYLRDAKAGYLNNIIPTLEYIVEVAANYAELNALGDFIQDLVIPKVSERLDKECK